MWLANFRLTQLDKHALLSPVGWITDTLIDASQQLLKQQFSMLSGLECVDLGLVMSFNVQPGEFLQILNTSHHHWLTISTIGVQHPEVCVFDSLYSCIPRMVQAQIATIMCTQNNSIEVKMMDVQQQVSSYTGLQCQGSIQSGGGAGQKCQLPPQKFHAVPMQSQACYI